MENLKKAVIFPLITDAKIATAGHLGYYLQRSTVPPYGIFEEFAPEETASGMWITYHIGAAPADNSRSEQTIPTTWEFTLWNARKPADMEPVKQLLVQQMVGKDFSTSTSFMANTYLAERGAALFDDAANAYYSRMIFDSKVKLYTRKWY